MAIILSRKLQGCNGFVYGTHRYARRFACDMGGRPSTGVTERDNKNESADPASTPGLIPSATEMPVNGHGEGKAGYLCCDPCCPHPRPLSQRERGGCILKGRLRPLPHIVGPAFTPGWERHAHWPLSGPFAGLLCTRTRTPVNGRDRSRRQKRIGRPGVNAGPNTVGDGNARQRA